MVLRFYGSFVSSLNTAVPEQVRQFAFTCSPGVFSLLSFLPESPKFFSSSPCPVWRKLYANSYHTRSGHLPHWIFETNIPRNVTARPHIQILHSCFGEQFIYSHDRSAYSAAGKYLDRSWKDINCSQTHECGNWSLGWAVPLLGIHKWDFRCSVTDFSISNCYLIILIVIWQLFI